MSTEIHESKNGQTNINYLYKTEEISGKFLHVVNEMAPRGLYLISLT